MNGVFTYLKSVDPKCLVKTRLSPNRIGIMYQKTYLRLSLNQKGVKLLKTHTENDKVILDLDLSDWVLNKLKTLQDSLGLEPESYRFVLGTINEAIDFRILDRVTRREILGSESENVLTETFLEELYGTTINPLFQAVGIDASGTLVYKVILLSINTSEVNYDIDFVETNE